MENLMEMLQSQLSEGMIDQLSNQPGGADRAKTASAASGALATLMGALAKNASTPQGAQALNDAMSL